MAAARWDEGLETGNDVLDQQHRTLNAYVDELRDERGGSRPTVLRVLDEMTDFALKHFATEEDLMRVHHYPPDATQRMVEQHEEFKSQLQFLVQKFRGGEMFGVDALQVFLEEFLKAHESSEDRLLARWVRERPEETAGA
jgi:hemerythrin